MSALEIREVMGHSLIDLGLKPDRHGMKSDAGSSGVELASRVALQYFTVHSTDCRRVVEEYSALIKSKKN